MRASVFSSRKLSTCPARFSASGKDRPMHKAIVALLWRFCLLAIGGCRTPSGGSVGSAASTPGSASSPTQATLAHCSQAPADQSGRVPAAPPSAYVHAGADGVVIVVDTWGVAAFTTGDGAKLWQVQQPAVQAGPVAADGMLYVGTVSGTGAPAISALSAGTGQQRWQMPLAARHQAALISLQRLPTAGSPSGQVFNGLSLINGVVVASYISTIPAANPAIATLNASTGQQGWAVQGVLLAVG